MRPRYTKRPIGSLEALSKALQVDLGVLKSTALSLDKHYHPHLVPKRDGSSRQIYIPTNHLKIIQKRINRQIFDNVLYPPYLYGGVKDKDYVKNASAHSGAEAVIALDVKNFYPSISYQKVVGIFQYFFKFPADVSSLLSDLCTFQNQVPQGACTSSHLANLVLHNTEYHFAQYCQSKKYVYTRLLDDISISSNSVFSEKEINKIISSVKKFLRESGLFLNKKKQKITSRSNPEVFMEVTGLWLNRGKPRAHRQDRRIIRAELHRCEMMAIQGRTDDGYHDLHNRVSGRVAKLSYLGHLEAEKYREILRDVLPVFDEHKTHSIYKQAIYLSKSKLSSRSRFSYFKKYHKVRYKVNILLRNNKYIANTIINIMNSCKPVGTKDELLYETPI